MNVTNLLNISIIEWDIEAPFFGSTLSILLIISALLGLLSSMATFTYIVLFLKLNHYLKLILGSLAIEQMSCFGTALVGHILMGFENFQSVFTCFLSLTPLTMAAYSNTNGIIMISSLRFYMTWKAEKTQIAKPSHIVAFIICNIIRI